MLYTQKDTFHHMIKPWQKTTPLNNCVFLASTRYVGFISKSDVEKGGVKVENSVADALRAIGSATSRASAKVKTHAATLQEKARNDTKQEVAEAIKKALLKGRNNYDDV